MSDARTQRLPTLEKEPQLKAGDAGGGDLEQSTSAAGYAPGGGPEPAGRAGRFWSTRRVPAGVVALLGLAASGLLLFDVVAVRTGRRAMAWRRTVADELATTHVNSTVAVAGAVVLALLGLWLLVLAFTPGRRGLLPMHREVPGVRAGLERQAVRLVLRDRAMQVPGVQTLRLDVGRRKVRVRAEARFYRHLDEVRKDLDSVLGDGIRELGLARPPSLSVHVRRPKKS